MTKILVVGHAKDPQTLAQISILREIGARVALISPQSGQAHKPVRWSDDAIFFADQRVDDADAVIVRAQVPLMPSAELFRQAPEGRLDFCTWFQLSCAARDRHDTVLALLLSLGERGMFNFLPSSRTTFFNLPKRLHCALRVSISNTPNKTAT